MSKFFKGILSAVLLLAALSVYAATEVKDGYSIVKETLNGSEITILVPDKYSKNLLLFAHGLRDAASPLSSGFSTEGEFSQELVKEGWIIGSTSYRRNGVILSDAVEDIEFLKKYIEDKYGKAENVYLEGWSMGGKILAMMAEKKDNMYKGALAIGAALTIQEEGIKSELTFAPQIPILFLTNESELKRPQDYIGSYKDGKAEPVLWKVNRRGHCNTNEKEELLAFRALIEYSKSGKIEKNKELLIEMPEKESAAVFKDGKAFAKVLTVDSAFGNMYVDLRKGDLKKLGIDHGEYFEIGFNNKVYTIFFGDTYSDVDYGFWVAFSEADGKFKVARNFRNAANLLKCKEGDTIFIRKLDKPKKEDQFQENPETLRISQLYWPEIMNKNFDKAIEYTLEAVKLSPNSKWILTNLGHCYLLSGKFEEARKIYFENIGTRLEFGNQYFEDSVLEDLSDMKQLKIDDPNIDKMIELYTK